jgi:GTP cyclohydrolase II
LYFRQNQAVIAQAAKVFVFIAQALEAETLQGQTATRVVQAAKALLSLAGLDPVQLLQQLSPETQQTVRAYFG